MIATTVSVSEIANNGKNDNFCLYMYNI